MGRAAFQNSLNNGQTRHFDARRDDDASGVDGFHWFAAGLTHEVQRRLDSLLLAHGLDDEALAEALSAETSKWLTELDAGERLEAALQIISRWLWLWHHDSSTNADDEELRTSLGAWIAADIEALITVAIDGLDRVPLSSDRLAAFVQLSASSLFDQSGLLSRRQVVDVARRTLENGPVTSKLIDALEALSAAEARPAAQARRHSLNQSSALSQLVVRARATYPNPLRIHSVVP